MFNPTRKSIKRIRVKYHAHSCLLWIGSWFRSWATIGRKNLDLDTFIEIHTEQAYLIYAIGFSPVFAFLGEVDKRIQAPRLATPRIKIPAGSVGIAESQTAVYPTDSSGGWNIVGRTLLDLSLNNPENVDKFRVGDKVKFYSITRDEYLKNGGLLWALR